MKKLLSDTVFRVQAIKVIFLALLLVYPFTFHNAIAKKSPPDAEKTEKTPPQKKEAKKNKKNKDPKPEEFNQLTREEGRKLSHQKFEIPASIRPAVNFWKMVYTQYDRRFEIFHDIENLSVVYSVLDFSELYDNPKLTEDERRSIRKNRNEAEKDRIRSILGRLAQQNYELSALSPEERKIYDLYKDDSNPFKFKEAAEGRIRSQTGIKDKFMVGIANSGAYMEEIEDIFASYGLPTELTRLCFVESMFNTKARSKVGASGIWQFMPSTGRLYVNIDPVIDERNDPVMASHAAARLLKSNYEALGTWPLAINAYNAGRGTMQNAVRTMRTDQIEEIINYYRGGVYGFASRNFYPSFLAALEVANHYENYFGKIERQPKTQYENYYLQNPAFLGELANASGMVGGELLNLNPHFTEDVQNGLKKIPAGYSIRIPKGNNSKFSQAEIMMGSRNTTQISGGTDIP